MSQTRDFVLPIVGVENVEGIAICNLDDLAGKGIGEGRKGASGNIMVESLWWADGSINRRPPRNDFVSEGLGAR